MKKRLIILIIIISIVSIVLVITLLTNQKKDIINKNVDDFKHNDISKLNMKENTYQNIKLKKYCSNIDSLGKIYCAAIIKFTVKKVTIEENLYNRYESDTEGETDVVESIIFSKSTLNEYYINTYIYSVHNEASCGTDLIEYKKIRDNYYYIEYKIPQDC